MILLNNRYHYRNRKIGFNLTNLKYRVNEYHAFLSFPLARVNFQNARDNIFMQVILAQARFLSFLRLLTVCCIVCSYLPLFLHFLPPLPKFPSPRK